jgi:hypothetical protein
MTAITEALAGREAEVRGDERTGEVAKNLLLFVAAPWIGLAYIVVFPFVGFGAMLGAVLRHRRA